ncbi:MAG: alpha/beta hydrolase [Reyranellaceae bacterium]
MLDGEVRLFLDLLEKAAATGRPKLSDLPVSVGRSAVDRMSCESEADPPEVARVLDGTLPGPAGAIPYRRYWPLGVDEKTIPTLVYYHGGGFVIGNIETHDSTCRRLANKSRCQVISIDYRLAPEHPFPASVDDGLAAFRHIRDNAAAFDTVADRIAVGGDSAGGNLSAVVCQQTKNAGEAMPAFQMLIYPATDSVTHADARRARGESYFLTQELMDWFFGHYMPAGTDQRDPRLSPLLVEDLSGLPPAYVLTAGYDPLRDEGLAYATKLRQAGVRTVYSEFPGTIHGFFSLTRFLRQGLVANDEAAGVLAAFFGR